MNFAKQVVLFLVTSLMTGTRCIMRPDKLSFVCILHNAVGKEVIWMHNAFVGIKMGNRYRTGKMRPHCEHASGYDQRKTIWQRNTLV